MPPSSLNSIAARVLLVCAALFVVLAGIKSAAAIVEPFLLSVFIAIICQPVITFLARFKIPKWLAVVGVIAFVVFIGMTITGLVAKSLNEFSLQIPVYRQELQAEFIWFADQLARFNVELNREVIIQHLDPGAAMSVATSTLTGVGNVMANFFVILLTSVFMLFEADSISKRLHLAIDDPEMHIKKIDQFLDSVKHYLAIKTVISLLTGVLAGLLCWLVGVDYFVLWGLLAFMLNYIPTIGSIIAAVPVILLALLEVGGAGAGIIAIGYAAINTIMGNAIEPRYMGKGLGISTLVVFLSLIFWGWLLGTVGMLLSVPLTMVVKIALESSDETRWLAVMLSSGEEVEDVVTKRISLEKPPLNES